ncbi:hypothetical protein CVT26_011349 [Gymnopilus dilepis]|uniref:F-box domain-containing protein n=1 Tax=Gymnopilus dilepis TaxID=231916 RepID=A0A409X0Q3_9AGAR|nr:hypothetical protein CVT26_011349 [Gymnopilus dilepis]
MFGFLELPPEVLVDILLHLHPLDIAACKVVCHSLYHIISNSSLIAYHVELRIAGMQNNPYCSLPVASRLKMLKDREAAWLAFEPKFTKNITVPFVPVGLYDVTPGFYLKGEELYAGARMTRSVQAIRLPHEVNEEPEWTAIDFESDIIDFATSIEEDDLVAAVKVVQVDGSQKSRLYVDLRRYSTKQPYDGVANPNIILDEVATRRGRPMVSIEIAGENLIVIPEFPVDIILRNPVPRLMYVVNWKTGKKKADPVHVSNPGLVFFREDMFLNPNMANSTIDIFHISETSVVLVKQLSFPALQPGRLITFIACRGDPSPRAKGAFPKHTPPWRPYANNPEDAVIIFAIQIGGEMQIPNDHADHYFMVVHRRALLSLLDASDFELDTPITSVPWESWGPSITRWLPAPSAAMNFITLSAGQRFVLLQSGAEFVGNDDEGGEIFEPRRLYTLLDFNPWNVMRLRDNDYKRLRPNLIRTVVGLPSPAQSTWFALSGEELPENICPRRNSFVDNVVSRLPYIKYSHLRDFDLDIHESVLIDEERLIGVKFVEVDSLDVMYFG